MVASILDKDFGTAFDESDAAAVAFVTHLHGGAVNNFLMTYNKF